MLRRQAEQLSLRTTFFITFAIFHSLFMQADADCHTIVIGRRKAAVVRSDEKGHNGSIGKFIEMGNGDVL